MQEEAHLDVDLLLDAGVPDGVGSQHQVVVMEPDDGNLTVMLKVLFLTLNDR